MLDLSLPLYVIGVQVAGDPNVLVRDGEVALRKQTKRRTSSGSELESLT
jgi:hypothetical protein